MREFTIFIPVLFLSLVFINYSCKFIPMNISGCDILVYPAYDALRHFTNKDNVIKN